MMSNLKMAYKGSKMYSPFAGFAHKHSLKHKTACFLFSIYLLIIL